MGDASVTLSWCNVPPGRTPGPRKVPKGRLRWYDCLVKQTLGRLTHEACLSALGFALLAGASVQAFAASAPARSDNDDPPSDSSSAGTADVSAPPATVPAASDSESPRAPRRATPRIHVPPSQEDETPLWLRHPGSGLTFDFGGFGGGTDLATAQLSDGTTETLSAGGGGFASVGGLWTPLWVGDELGLGLGGYVGVKYQTVGASNSNLSLTRFPIGVAAHALVRISERWFLLLRGGVQKEYGISISGGGDMSGNIDVDGAVGPLGEGGFYYVTHVGQDRMAVALTFRYTSAHDSVGGMTFSANSAGGLLAIHYNL